MPAHWSSAPVGSVILLHLPAGDGTDGVLAILTAATRRLPPALWRSIAWDRGIQMTRHLDFTPDTASRWSLAPLAHPGSVNTNGLLRQYLLKGTDLSEQTSAQLQVIADLLSDRPRRTVGWQTPNQAMTRSVASVV